MGDFKEEPPVEFVLILPRPTIKQERVLEIDPDYDATKSLSVGL